MINAEIKRTINIKVLIVLLIIGVFMLIYNANNFIGDINSIKSDVINEAIKMNVDANEMEKIKTEVNTYIKSYGNSYMAWRFSVWGYEIVCILLATSVCAFSYIVDKKSGILKNILIRVSKKRFFITKYLINGISGGIIINIPVIIVTGIFFLKFGVGTLPTLEAYFPKGFMSEYFITNPNLYILFFGVVLFFIGFTYSTFAMAVAMFTKNIISTILIPLIYWFGGSLVTGALNLYNLAPWNIYYFYADQLYSFKAGVIHCLILLIISTGVIYNEYRKEEI
ncbi:hypothetical protein [uncultured Clostridium sp.]|uniref:hypothetical protein n=1 Tax=uncultured Clostridium sp. TaxID=59620 RepID=UPI0025930AE1|nr:hypothetical protein [uncultured Clostridium sp.]